MVQRAVVDREHRLFCYALVPGRWLVGGAINNGGVVLEWLGGVLGESEPDRLLAEAARVPPGSDGLVMLPYLLGERAPLLERPAARRLRRTEALTRSRSPRARGARGGLSAARPGPRLDPRSGPRGARGPRHGRLRPQPAVAPAAVRRARDADRIRRTVSRAPRSARRCSGWWRSARSDSIETPPPRCRWRRKPLPDPAAVSLYERQRPSFTSSTPSSSRRSGGLARRG